MLKNLPARFLVLALIISLPAMANLVIVKGTIKYSNGVAAVKRAVYIMPDTSTVKGCTIQHIVYTNADGFYSDTLNCTNAILKLRLKAQDCDSSWLLKDPQVPASGIAEINFSLSCVASQKCSANFTFENDNTEYGLHFNSSSSTGDSIVSRTWKFGDGTSLAGNNKDPHHSYDKGGAYAVCLIIKTASGCESSLCRQVEVSNHCVATFKVSLDPPMTVKVNSSSSHGISATDEIVERTWNWGDGTLSKGNLIDPSHLYSKPGKYELCLKITTSRKCIDSTCTVVTISEPSKVCYARFKVQNTLGTNTVKFITDSIGVSANDTVSTFSWYFGDGIQQTVTTPQAEHRYELPGTYNVCLVIKTIRNCEFKFCSIVTVAPASKCIAAFSSEKIGPKKIRVNASLSTAIQGDSIVKRSWNFGDGHIASDNLINPAHEYKDFGVYNVCLTIKTAKGCENTYCATIKVDSIYTIQDNSSENIKIVELYPNPVSTQLNAIIYSRNNNVPASIAIHDIYGNLKSTFSTVLLQGSNVVKVPVTQLMPGTYLLQVKTIYGNPGKSFFKL